MGTSSLTPLTGALPISLYGSLWGCTPDLNLRFPHYVAVVIAACMHGQRFTIFHMSRSLSLDLMLVFRPLAPFSVSGSSYHSENNLTSGH